ncbi:MAG: O-antigen ligase family protein [Bacteroidia bacterium]|jgi:O-antigen ligase|nr:O-antigen ligase family protein [Bacteroidia bacterium]
MKNQQLNKAFNNWVQVLYDICIVLLPLVYSAHGVDPVLLPRQVLLNIFIGCTAIVLWKRVKSSFSIQSILPLLFLAIAICYLVSIQQAINETEAWYISVKIIGFALFLIAMYWCFTYEVLTWQKVTLAIALSGVLASALALRDIIYLQTHGIPIFKSDNMYRVNATFGHKNLLSGYLFVTLPPLLMQCWGLRSKALKFLFVFFSAVQTVLILTLQTRAVILAIGIALGVCVVLFALHPRANKKLRWTIVLFLLSFSLLGGILVFGYSDKLTLLTRTESFIERKNVWDNTWQMIQEFPITGVGAGNWQIHFPKYGMGKFYEVNYTITEGLTTFQRPHNDFLWVFAETGIVGGLCYLLFFALSLYFIIILFYKQVETKLLILHALIIFQLVGFVFISLVDFPLERIEHLWIMLSAIAWIAANYSGKFSLTIPRFFTWLIVLLVGYSIYVCVYRWQSERVQKVLHLAHAKNNSAMLIKAGNASINKYANMDHFTMPLLWYVGVGYFLNNDVTTAKHFFASAYVLNPYQVHVINNYATCFVAENNYDKAIPLLEASAGINPKFSAGILNLSGAYYNTSRYKDAYTVLLRFKYDEQNEHFKVIAVAVLRKILELEITKNKQQTYLKQIVANDQQLLDLYKEAQLNKTDFLTYVLNQNKSKYGTF